MASSSAFEKRADHVGARSWEDVRSAWATSIPNLDDPGQKPESRIEDIPLLRKIVDEVRASTSGTVLQDVPGLRSALLHHSLYAIHRACHVLGAAEAQTVEGRPTWSLSTAYQAAHLASQGLLGFLGIGLIQVSSVWLIFDVWPEPKEMSKRDRLAYRLGQAGTLVISASNRPEHFHKWYLLQRTLRTLKGSPFPAELLSPLKLLNAKDFASQRNALHYRDEWFFNDLLTLCGRLAFVRFRLQAEVARVLREQEEGFSIALAMTLVHFCHLLMHDLGRISTVIEECRAASKEAMLIMNPVYPTVLAVA